MELRQLRYFNLICKTKNFTKAANEAYISQPSITNSIRKLEEELNIKLFDRSQKQIYLTPEGLILSKRVEIILGEIDDAITEIQDYAETKKNSITLGVTPVMGAYYFPDIYLEFKKKYPNMFLHIIENGSNSIKELLKEGSLDMELGIILDNDSSYDTHVLIKKQLCVCVAEENPLALKKKVTFDDMKNQSFILFQEGSYIRELILQYFKHNNFEPKIAISTNQLETIKAFVANNIGVAFMFENSIEKEKNIISIPLENPLYISSGLITVKNKYLSKASKTFIDFIKSYKSPVMPKNNSYVK